MERILAATDMTEEDDIALRRAEVLARRLGGGQPDDLHAMFETSLMARLESMAGALRKRSGLKVTARTGVGTD